MARLIEELRKLPASAPRAPSASPSISCAPATDDASALADAVRELKAKLRLCSICNNITDVDPCVYCASPTRNQRLVCVVEEPTNIAVHRESTRSYNGVYHVLHGTLSPLHGVGPEQLRTAQSAHRVERAKSTKSSSPPAPPSKAKPQPTGSPPTAQSPVKHHPHRHRRPAGSDIEYADEVTMTRAIEGRREL